VTGGRGGDRGGDRGGGGVMGSVPAHTPMCKQTNECILMKFPFKKKKVFVF
jgi:hypothetical protein